MIRKEQLILKPLEKAIPDPLRGLIPTEKIPEQVSFGRFCTKLPYSPLTENLPSIDKVTFEVSGNLKLDEQLTALSEGLAKNLRFNGTTQAITDIQFNEDGSVHLVFKSCRYSDYMATSIAGSKNQPHPQLDDKTAIEYFQDKGFSIDEILQIGQNCPLVKPLGVSALILTSDGFLIISSSASWVHNSPGLLVPPASGSADIGPDYITGETKNIVEFIQREFDEEVDKDGNVKFTLIGLDTEINRLGKPEAFFLGYSDKTLLELAKSKSKDDEITGMQENDSKVAMAFKILDGDKLIFNQDLLDLIAMTRDPVKGKEIFERKFIETQRMIGNTAIEQESTPKLNEPFVSYPLQAALYHLMSMLTAKQSELDTRSISSC